MLHFVLSSRRPNFLFNLRSLNHLHHSNTSPYITHFVLSPILGDGNVDKTASPNAQESSDGNIYVTAGNYNITVVIDAAASTKKVTIAAI